MKKIALALLLICSVSLSASAQTDEYRQKTRELIELGTTSINAKQMKQGLKETMGTLMQTLTQLIPADVKNSGAAKDSLDLVASQVDGLIDNLFGGYFENGEFTNDVTDLMTPVLQRQLTLDELKQVEAKYKSAEGQVFLNKCNDVIPNMSTAMSGLLTPMMTIVTGGDVPEIERVDCPAEYREVFNQYLGSTMGDLTEQIKKQLGEKAEEGTPQARAQQYMIDALPETILRMTHPTVSINDLRASIKFTQDPLIQRYLKACSNVTEADTKALQEKINSRLSNLLNFNLGE